MPKPASIRSRWKRMELSVAKHFDSVRCVHGRGEAGDTDTDIVVNFADYGVEVDKNFLFVECKYSNGTDHIINRRYEEAGKPHMALWGEYFVCRLPFATPGHLQSLCDASYGTLPVIESSVPAHVNNAYQQCVRSCESNKYDCVPSVAFGSSAKYKLFFIKPKDFWESI